MKRISRRNAGGTAWVLEEEMRFIYEGWNLLAEVSTLKPGSATARAVQPVRSYLWGEDLSGTETGAGGVGGLLMVRQHAAAVGESWTGWQVPCLDGNGNVMAYLDGDDGEVMSRYEYDPFGRTVVAESVARYSKTGTSAGRRVAVEAPPFRFSTKYQDRETGLVCYGFRYYAPEWGRWLSRDPIGERGGLNLYRFCFNDGINWFDYLGWNPVNGGISVPNGTGSTANGQNDHFDKVADDGADKGKNQRANSGKEMLDFMQELSKNGCCIKTLTVAGHGWDSVQRDGTPAGDGPGLPGVADGSGLYEDGPSGDRWATDPNARRLSDLEKDIADGKTTFCKPCEVRIHACNIAPGFAEKLGSITKCKVIYARGACSGRNPWRSGVGKEPGYNNKDNGFWESDGGLPSTPTGNSYRP
jgi:RHS repeat-associated protein